MPRLHTDWTAAQAMALPDDDTRYEVLDGELVVMPPPRVVERWGPGDDVPLVCRETLTWQPVGAAEALVIDLGQLFAPVAGERA